MNGKTFIKEWFGDVNSIVGPILIKDASGFVWYNDPLPLNHKIIITNVPHGTEMMIQWKDWRGVMQERHTVECINYTDYLKNDIPYPKFIQTTKTLSFCVF